MHNLIENGDFRHSGTPAYGWTGTNLGTSDGCVTATSAAPQLDSTVLKIVGSPTSQKRVSQTVKVSGNEGDTLILSGWAKGNAAPDDMEGAEPDGTVNDRVFGLVATINYTDNTTEKVTATFNPDVENWQYWGAESSVLTDIAAFADTILCNIHGHLHNYRTGLLSGTTIPRVCIPNMDFYRSNERGASDVNYGRQIPIPKLQIAARIPLFA